MSTIQDVEETQRLKIAAWMPEIQPFNVQRAARFQTRIAWAKVRRGAKWMSQKRLSAAGSCLASSWRGGIRALPTTEHGARDPNSRSKAFRSGVHSAEWASLEAHREHLEAETLLLPLGTELALQPRPGAREASAPSEAPKERAIHRPESAEA